MRAGRAALSRLAALVANGEAPGPQGVADRAVTGGRPEFDPVVVPRRPPLQPRVGAGHKPRAAVLGGANRGTLLHGENGLRANLQLPQSPGGGPRGTSRSGTGGDSRSRAHRPGRASTDEVHERVISAVGRCEEDAVPLSAEVGPRGGLRQTIFRAYVSPVGREIRGQPSEQFSKSYVRRTSPFGTSAVAVLCCTTGWTTASSSLWAGELELRRGPHSRYPPQPDDPGGHSRRRMEGYRRPRHRSSHVTWTCTSTVCWPGLIRASANAASRASRRPAASSSWSGRSAAGVSVRRS